MKKLIPILATLFAFCLSAQAQTVIYRLDGNDLGTAPFWTSTNLQTLMTAFNASSVTLNAARVSGLGSAALVSTSTFEVPLTFSTGLTRTTNSITVNTSQNIATLSNLTGNGLVRTSGGTGLLSVDTTSYLTSSSNILAAQMPAFTGDIATSAGAIATTLASVNGNVGTFGSTTKSGIFTVNAKGLITAASESTITPAVGSITGLGAGVGSALTSAVNGSGAIVLTTGSALSASVLTSGTVPTARLGSGTADNTVFLRGDSTWVAAPSVGAGSGLTLFSGNLNVNTSQNINTLSNLTSNGLVKTASGTGALSVVGLGTGVEAALGTAVDGSGAIALTTSPTFVTPLLGTPTSGNLSNCTALNASVLASGTVPTDRLGTGTASSSTFLRGDNTWAAVGAGTVTSVAASVPSFLSISGSPITSSGTFAITLSGTALPVANGGTGITAFGTGVASALGTAVNGTGAILLVAGSGASLTGLTKTQVGLSAVENTALSTWTGSSSLTTYSGGTFGTAATGTLNTSSTLAPDNNSIPKYNSSGGLSAGKVEVAGPNGYFKAYGIDSGDSTYISAGIVSLSRTTSGGAGLLVTEGDLSSYLAAGVLTFTNPGSIVTVATYSGSGFDIINPADSNEHFSANHNEIIWHSPSLGNVSWTPSVIEFIDGSTALSTISDLDASKLIGTVPTARLGTGTASSSTFLRGDNTWATAGAGTVTSVAASVPSFLSISGSPITSSGTLAITLSGTALPVANGGTSLTALGTGVVTALGTAVNGSGAIALTTSPTFVTPLLGTPTSGNLSNCTAINASNISSGTLSSARLDQAYQPYYNSLDSIGNATHTSNTMLLYSTAGPGGYVDLATTSTGRTLLSASGVTGTGSVVQASSPTLVTPLLGTPTSGNLSNCTALNASALATGTVPTARLGTGTADSTTFLRGDNIWTTAGAGTVSSVSVTTANGVSGSVATSTSTPAITLTLGAITPTSINGLTVSTSTGTLTVPNGVVFTGPASSGTAAVLGNAQTFTAIQTLAPTTAGNAITINSGSVTTSLPAIEVNQTWNASGTVFRGKRTSITQTAYSNGIGTESLIEEWRGGSAGTTSLAAISANGGVTGTGFCITSSGHYGSGNWSGLYGSGDATILRGGSGYDVLGVGSNPRVRLVLRSDSALGWSANTTLAYADVDAFFMRDSAATIQLGADITSGSPTTQTIKAHDGITGTNISGANLTVASGNSTGTGTSSITISTPAAGSTGTTARTAARRATFASTGVSIQGTTTNDSATAGDVGEVVSSAVVLGSAVSLTTATATNVTSVSLTAGDWDVAGNVNYSEGSATVSARAAGINSTSATIPTDGSEAYLGTITTIMSADNTVSLTMNRISVAATTTVYLVGKATFSAGTVSAYGKLYARRAR